ncbi:MAG: ATP-binding cassette domain-containing protein [Bdellovibrionota bacterium]|nr:ATP-binding cassette domain-containing protein [Pseudomonadota bacterium]MDY6089764.1 ATP-binding cassette domain-containing protein [Bdellovibrionota bacterium]
MIELNNVSKYFGTRCLFDEVNFFINEKDKIGLVGLNGSGKSTLFKILAGLESIDSGNIRIPKDYKIGYLTQHINLTKDTILNEALSSIPKDEDGTDKTYLAKAMLSGLGFTDESLSLSPYKLSGGFQVRLELAKLLLTNPNLLLLDEPSNYLDIVSIRWLTKFLRNWKNELLLISHDRGFVNSIVNHTLGIHRKKILKIKGKIEDYEKVIREQEELYEKTRINQESKIAHMQRFVDKLGAKATKAKAAQSRIKMIEKIERLDELQKIKTLDFKFKEEPLQGKTAMSASNLSFGYNNDNILIKDLSFILKKNDRIGIIGKNGKGKTTLLRLLLGELTPFTGTISTPPLAKISYFGQTNIERLDPKLTVEEEIWSVDPLMPRTNVRSICGLMMFQGDDALKQVSVLSGGEKSRVLLGKILVKPSNILLLDEPTNHLDLSSTDALIEATSKFNGAVLIVTHSENILRKLVNKLIIFQRDGILFFDGNYDEFLEKIGWEDEFIENETQKEVSQNSKKEARKQRADELTKRNQLLRPLRKEVEKIENEITQKEDKLKAIKEELLLLYTQEYTDKVKTLESDCAYLESQIEESFLKLEEANNKLEEAIKKLKN